MQIAIRVSDWLTFILTIVNFNYVYANGQLRGQIILQSHAIYGQEFF
jgi:hypothetical protein